MYRTDDYAVLERKNLTKLHILAAKHKVNTYCEKLFPSDDCASMLTPSETMTSRETQE